MNNYNKKNISFSCNRMVFKWPLLMGGLLIFSSHVLASGIPADTVINLCSDEGGWPPYNYYNKAKRIQGYDIDILKKVFKPNGVNYSMKLLPWKRCLHWGKHGKKYQIVTSGGSNEERRKTYLYSRDYYQITPSYFYSKTRFPDGLDIKRNIDFKKWKVCGILGYNYANYNLPVEDIDVTARETKQVVEKLERERCDVFLAQYEIFVGFSYLGENYIEDYDLAYAPIPEGTTDKFYFMISRHFKYANELKALIDKEIDKLESEGELKRMIDVSIEKIKTQG